jgi:hypothetical protein
MITTGRFAETARDLWSGGLGEGTASAVPCSEVARRSFSPRGKPVTAA